MKRLFIVEEFVVIKERGTAAAGPCDDPKNARYRVGDMVEIRRLDGSTACAVISGIPIGMMRHGFAEVLLTNPITKVDVGTGDEIWIASSVPS